MFVFFVILFSQQDTFNVYPDTFLKAADCCVINFMTFTDTIFT